ISQDRICSAHRRLTVVEWIPGYAESWLEVLVVFFIDVINSGTDSLQRSRCRIENDEPVVALGRRHIPVITKTEFQSHVRAHFVVVLHVKSECILDDGARTIAQRDVERIGSSGHETRETGEGEVSRIEGEIVVVKTPRLTTKLE